MKKTTKTKSQEFFKRVAKYLHDYANIQCDCYGEKDSEYLELLELEKRVLELQGEFEAKQNFDKPEQAAQIIAGMLHDWKIPGAVWYEPTSKRFRVVGENYNHSSTEILCGVYLNTVKESELVSDLEEVMKGG